MARDGVVGNARETRTASERGARDTARRGVVVWAREPT
jgi:hypothetical protein